MRERVHPVSKAVWSLHSLVGPVQLSLRSTHNVLTCSETATLLSTSVPLAKVSMIIPCERSAEGLQKNLKYRRQKPLPPPCQCHPSKLKQQPAEWRSDGVNTVRGFS